MIVAVAGSLAYSQVKTTSSAVNGRPSCHFTPRFSFHTTDLPSAATVPSSRFGIAAASIGRRLPSLSQPASGSKKMREASRFELPPAKWGLSRVGACHNRILIEPPPPRRVGL